MAAVKCRNSEMDIIMESGVFEQLVNWMKYRSCLERVPPITLELADGSKLIATLEGTVHVNFGGRKHTLIKAYLIPQLKLISLSYSRLVGHGISITFEKGKCIFPTGGRKVGVCNSQEKSLGWSVHGYGKDRDKFMQSQFNREQRA